MPKAQNLTRAAGLQLRLWRETRQLTRAYIANAMGVTVRTVTAWERMQSTIPSTQLARLAPILEIPLSRLLEAPESATTATPPTALAFSTPVGSE